MTAQVIPPTNDQHTCERNSPAASTAENTSLTPRRYQATLNKKVCVVGLGYVGLPTASILAAKGYQVHGVDVRPAIVESIGRGEILIEEPDLNILVRSAVNSKQLRVSLRPEPADVFIICVPTPQLANHAPDLSYVEQACQAIRDVAKRGDLIILESTSPPGTTVDIVARTAVPLGLTVGRDVFVAYCPERVLPGRILLEVVQNDRVVGGVTKACTERARQFYESFVNGNVIATTAVVAELTKLAENAYRDVNIAFANEIASLADDLGVDPWEVIRFANHHPRVNILSPGPGVGGHCISVDPWFLVYANPKHTPLIRTAREVNDRKPIEVVEKVMRLARQFTHPTIGCLGLTYKADIDDLRESPALHVVRELLNRGCENLLICDPYVRPDRLDDITLTDLSKVLSESQILVLLTDHREFREIPENVLQEKVLVDTRGAWRQQHGRPSTRLTDGLPRADHKHRLDNGHVWYRRMRRNV